MAAECTPVDTSPAGTLRRAADFAATDWDPSIWPIVEILDHVADGGGRHDSVGLWDAIVTHLDEELTVPWERQPGRTRAQVAVMLNAAADGAQR